MEHDTNSIRHCRDFLTRLELIFRDFEGGMTPPVPYRQGDGYVLRFPKKDIHHAMLLKLAALLQFLNGAIQVCESGLVMAQGALERMADEAGDDASFLALGICEGITDRHEDFLAAFWADDHLDPADVTEVKKPRQVRREKIHAALHRDWDDPSTAGKIAKRLSATYSGFVHAAAPNVMEMYDHRDGRFKVCAGPDFRRKEHEHDLWNYVYRGGLTFIAAAKAFGSQPHVDTLEAAIIKFQADSARYGGYGPEP